MADATQDRIDRLMSLQLGRAIRYDREVLDRDADVFYEGTLAQVAADGTTATPVDHTDSEDDSDLLILAVTEHQDDHHLTGGFGNDRAGRDPTVRLYDSVILELENGDSDLAGYVVGADAFAMDNQTVSASAGDGSGGTYATAGRVYKTETKSDGTETVQVLITGITK